MNNIVFGQFVLGDSYMYRLDSRVKIISLIILLITTFILPNILSILAMLLFTILLIVSSKVPLLKVLRGIKPLAFLLTFTFVLQIVYNQKGEIYSIFDNPLIFNFHFGLYSLLAIIGLILLWMLLVKFIPFKIMSFFLIFLLCFVAQYYLDFGIIFSEYTIGLYKDGVNNALFVFVRVLIVVLLSSLLTFTTKPSDINNAIDSLLSPLKVFKINVGVFGMMISITIRFVPTLLMETQKVMNAQASRGVDFKEGKLKEKVNQIISLLVPMFVISFKRADELANAMEARGYVIGDERSKYDEMKMHLIDYSALFIVLLVFALSIVVSI